MGRHFLNVTPVFGWHTQKTNKRIILIWREINIWQLKCLQGSENRHILRIKGTSLFI